MARPHRLAFDLLLFDLDGVLIDSTPCIVRHWKQWADRHGLDIDLVLAAAHGVRTIETMRAVVSQREGISHLDLTAEAARFTAHEVADTEGVTAISGARELLSGITSHAWAIVTSAGRDLARTRLRRAGLPIPEMLVCADDVKRGKPHPEPYTLGALRSGCAPDRCVVVEDAPAGVAAGHAAGMRVIGVGASHPAEALFDAGATVVVDRLAQLRIIATATDFHVVIRTESG